MKIFLNVLFLIIGLALLIKGADFFVSGASAVAKKLKVPSMIIGLTIVAIGTSLPELAVSVTTAIKGSTDMSIGNIVGSNMFNMLMCLGVVCMIRPIFMGKTTKKIDLPFMLLLTTLLALFGLDKYLNGSSNNILSRTESIVFLGILVFYMFITVRNALKDRKEIILQENIWDGQEEMIEQANAIDDENAKSDVKKEKKAPKELKTWQIILYLLLGMAAVVFGGECVSSTSQFLAIAAGMSEALVGLTIVAFGTSLPEFVTGIVAARRGENELALGNIIGSNIINIALILGLSGVITQIGITIDILVDTLILLASTIIFVALCLNKNQLTRWKGFVLVGIYVAYITFAIVRNYVL